MAAISQEDDKIIIYRLLENGEEKTIKLTNGESDPDQGKISRVSPLGIALSEKKVGEIVEVKISNLYLLESEKYILLLAAGKDYSLNGYQEHQIGRDYLKENKPSEQTDFPPPFSSIKE
ncbi:3888_t:CDS:2 [Ambispora gerdemannii]|uniref:3888_t:CDS:1 n=1 Tax=Ambispora gerdemannii TaxID=144530 RepID=A0A9N8YUC8_9GLOM|nr:3888_t:CDS:2 [Ambispora gerdemannii]